MVTSKTAKNLTYGDIVASAEGVATVYSVEVDMFADTVTVETGDDLPTIYGVTEEVEILNYSEAA